VVSLRKSLLLLTPVALVAAVACSTTPLPHELGNCIPIGDAGCTTSGAVVGSASGGDSDGGQSSGTTTTSCQVTSADSLCNQCLLPACCNLVTACFASEDCVALWTCISQCSTSGCVGSCDTDHPASLATYDNIVTCEEAKCPVCAQSGVGDPCALGCVTGTMCNGSWCTKVCANDTDCTGTGGGGGNVEGTANVCVFVAGTGNTCAPTAPANGCVATTYPGTFLDTTTDVSGSPVTVCALITDGG
jgi:hypothetical protein